MGVREVVELAGCGPAVVGVGTNGMRDGAEAPLGRVVSVCVFGVGGLSDDGVEGAGGIGDGREEAPLPLLAEGFGELNLRRAASAAASRGDGVSPGEGVPVDDELVPLCDELGTEELCPFDGVDPAA